MAAVRAQPATLPLAGYQITRLLETSKHTQVYAALREHDQRPVVAKLFELGHDEGLDARVEHEFRQLRELELEGVGRPLDLVRGGEYLALVNDWCEGQALGDYCRGRQLDLHEALGIARKLAHTLTEIHARGIVHRDIKPSKVIVEPNSGQVTLIDFGISALLDVIRERINDPEVIAGTLPYLAPEQTGRTGREVDLRSDLYSLGAVFYEMLTGRPPFLGTSPLELIHAHLARRADPPQWLRPEISPAISAVVMKLLEKAPEQRYQSARGLHHDLLHITKVLEAGGSLDEFTPGREDVPTTLQLPHRLYGRQQETRELVQALASACEGRPQCRLITGPTGIGKSSLIDQLAGPVMSRRGFVARGRFEREQLDKPYGGYGGFIAAFSDLADQLLTQPDEQLEHWRRRLRRLRHSGAVLAELVPKLAAIIGDTPQAPELGPVESRNRLALACAGLIATFARAEHPLIIALDDLQWADEASLSLVQTALSEQGSALLVVATARMDGLADDHPFRRWIEGLAEGPGEFGRFELSPLGRDDVASLVADTLAWPIDRVRPLAELVGGKAAHNPFFVRQFLTQLVERGLLWPTPGGWEWETQAIESTGVSDDLLEMMTAKIDRLPPSQRELLTVAAVIGMRFDLTTLETLVGRELVREALVPLSEEGLIAPGRAHYTFTHPRIRDAAYQTLPAARRVELHRIISDAWLERLGGGSGGDLLELVDHVDLGYGLVPLEARHEGEELDAPPEPALSRIAPQQRLILAELNSLAANKALSSSGPQAAVGYFDAGLGLLAAEDGPSLSPADPLVFELRLGRCEALGLSGAHARARRAFQSLLASPLDDAQLGRVVVKLIEMLISAREREAAVRAALDGLERLRVEIPQASPQAILDELVTILTSVELHDLARRPRLEDPRLRAAAEVLSAVISITHFVAPELHVALVTLHTRIVHEHGRHPSAHIGLALAGMVVSAGTGRRRLGAEVAELARSLSELPGNVAHRHRLAPSYWMLASWIRPYHEGVMATRAATTAALEGGDLEYAGYTAVMSVTMSLSAGAHLPKLHRMAEAAVRRLRQWHGALLVGAALGYARFAELLLGDDPEPSTELEYDVAFAYLPARIMIRTLRARLCCLLGRWAEAHAIFEQISDIERVMFAAWHVCDDALFRGLSAAVLAADAEPSERHRLCGIVDDRAAALRRYAELAPSNCESRALLLAAESRRLAGADMEALKLYGDARKNAAEHHVGWIEALALERTADLMRAGGLVDLAWGPLREARARYLHWGARAKVAQLERHWPELGMHALGHPHEDAGTADPDAGGSSLASRALDLATILKVSQTIGEDIRLEDVVDRVMAIALENAGAERGVLMLRGDEGLELVATLTVEERPGGVLSRPIPFEQAGEHVPISLLHWVERTREPAILDDASDDQRFARDPYIETHGVRSVLCLPIVKHKLLVGLLYLENKYSAGSFTGDRLEVLHLLMAQAASALENARLFEALRTSEVRWRSLVEGLPDVVLLVDPAGRVEFINHLEDEDQRGSKVGQLGGSFIHEDHIGRVRAQMRRVFEDACLAELEILASLGGPMRWFSVRLAPIAVDGKVERVIVVATDISERREAAAAKAALEAQLRQQQRLEAIGTLASGVAHEINNPVQGIMNYAELISISPKLDEDIGEYAAEISRESERVANIVRDLLAFSRAEGERRAEATVVKTIIEGTLSLIRTVLRKDQIMLSLELDEELPEVVCRGQQIQQVIMNLVTNARDALSARWPDHHEDKRIVIRACSFVPEGGEHPWVRISVADKGGGISPEVAARIFDPFFTTKGRDQGTGLGLAVSHGIVAEHGGVLRLENHPGEGACFHIELPCNPGAQLAALRGAPTD